MARRMRQARIVPHLSIRRLFQRRRTPDEAVEDDKLVHIGSASTSGRRRSRHKEDGDHLRLPHSLAPWHTLPFMTREVRQAREC